ncbi:MAG TPA: OmpH family outer membrane protein, partial [Opitutales bacterium]|nr:OmpH family outer membrane protein [Opitutales bacterium]
ALALSAGISAAQSFGIVDAPRASQAYWKFQSDTKTLQDEQQRLQELQQSFRGSIDQLAKDIDALNQDANNTALSDEARAAKKKEADDKTAQVQTIQSNFQLQVQRFQRRAQEVQAADEADVMAAIQKVAKANNMDVVFTSNAAFYAKTDITDQVIEVLNSNEPKAPAAAPASN